MIKNYTFSTAAREITLTDVTTVSLDHLALITDTTTNKILYNFADSTVSTATVATNVITLSTLQGGENNTDKLRIDYTPATTDVAFADNTSSVALTTATVSLFNKMVDNILNYKLSDEDYSTPGTVYRGFVDKDGNWFIVQEVATSTEKTVRYFKGDATYASNQGYEGATTGGWDYRASITYNYFHIIF